MGVLKEAFRPEFLNRIDEIVIFNYLNKVEIRRIVDLELDKVSKRLKAKGIRIEVTEAAKEFLVERGFDVNLGARPLKRVIQKMVLDTLALKIVSRETSEGDRVIVDLKNGVIVLENPATPKPAKVLVNG